MKQVTALKSVLTLFNKSGLPYMITGAYAVSYYGEPRATHDVDVMIEISNSDIKNVYSVFSKGYELDKSMVENAIRYHTHFTSVHLKSGLHIDFWLVKDKEYERLKFARRNKITLFGIRTFIISLEDIVLTKLEWFVRSKNTKHFDDVVGIIKAQKGRLDIDYMSKWIDRLEIMECWEKAKTANEKF